MEIIPTAEEFVKILTNSGGGRNIYSRNEVAYIAKEFSKLHVEAALRAASENVRLIDDPDSFGEFPVDQIIDGQSILTAYPLELIK